MKIISMHLVSVEVHTYTLHTISNSIYITGDK